MKRFAVTLGWLVVAATARAQGEPAPVPAPAAEASPGPSLKVNGYLQVQGFLPVEGDGDGLRDPSGFLVRRARIRVLAELGAGFGAEVMIDAADVENLLKNGFLTWSPGPYLKLRAGQQKTQFGFENPRSTSALYWINRSDVSSLGRGPKDLRDIGLGAFGSFDATKTLQFVYAVTLVNGAGPNVAVDDTPGKNVWGRVGANWKLAESWSLEAGISGGGGEHLDEGATPPQPVPFSRGGVDVLVDAPWFFAVTEVIAGYDGDAPSWGAYATVAGKTRWNAGPVARYERLSRGGELSSGLMLGAYWDVVPKRARLYLNYEHDLSAVPADNVLLLQVQGTYGD